MDDGSTMDMPEVAAGLADAGVDGRVGELRQVDLAATLPPPPPPLPPLELLPHARRASTLTTADGNRRLFPSEHRRPSVARRDATGVGCGTAVIARTPTNAAQQYGKLNTCSGLLARGAPEML